MACACCSLPADSPGHRCGGWLADTTESVPLHRTAGWWCAGGLRLVYCSLLPDHRRPTVLWRNCFRLRCWWQARPSRADQRARTARPPRAAALSVPSDPLPPALLPCLPAAAPPSPRSSSCCALHDLECCSLRCLAWPLGTWGGWPSPPYPDPGWMVGGGISLSTLIGGSRRRPCPPRARWHSGPWVELASAAYRIDAARPTWAMALGSGVALGRSHALAHAPCEWRDGAIS